MDPCQAFLIDRNYQNEVTVSVIKIDGNMTQFILKIIGSSYNLNFDLKQLFAREITREKGGHRLLFTTTSGIYHLIFPKEENAKQLHDLIVQKSDVHMMNGILDSLDKGVSAVWPFPGGLLA